MIDRIKDKIVFGAKDFGQNELDAFLYGIVVGWNGTDEDSNSPEIPEGIKKEFAERFNWGEKEWEVITCMNIVVGVLNNGYKSDVEIEETKEESVKEEEKFTFNDYLVTQGYKDREDVNNALQKKGKSDKYIRDILVYLRHDYEKECAAKKYIPIYE